MALEILDHEHQELIAHLEARRLAAERRHAVPGCGYGCEDGFHEIALGEYGPLDAIPEDDPAVIVLPWMLLFACECNSAGGGVWRGLVDMREAES